MLEKLKEIVCACNKELPRYRLVVMTSGNVSGRDIDSGYVVIKPSGFSYDELTPDDMVVLDLDGNIIEGTTKPSVDTDTHLYVYRNRPDVNGISHTHSTFCSTFAALGQTIPACLTAIAMLGGEVPLGKFVPIGGEQIGEEIIRSIGGNLAILMQNHGVFTIGKDAEQATKMAVEVEEIAKITYFAMLRGQPRLINQEDLEKTGDLYRNIYGQQ